MTKPLTRVVHFDFHTMPKIDDFGARFDADALAEQLEKAHVGAVQMFGRCNLGFSYYPTKVGVPYPNLKGDMLGDTVRACHKRGIRVIGYLHAGLCHELLLRHPDWARVEQDGTVYNFSLGQHYFRVPCFFGGYAEHLIKEAREVLALGVDGLFLDGISPRTCYCPACRAGMKRAGLDTGSEADAERFAARAARTLAERIRALVPEGKTVYFKGLPLRETRDLNSHAEIACLPSNMGYDFFPAQAAYARPLADNVLYMFGRFGYDWGDFGGYKGKASVENDVFDALLAGVNTTFADHLHPAEIGEGAIYEDLSEIYGFLEQIEPYTMGARYMAEIALLSADGSVTPAHEGAARIFGELKYSFDVLSVEDDFSAYPLVVLPDDILVDEALSARLDAYLARGGRVLATGRSGLRADGSGFASPAWDFTYAGEDETEISYYRLLTPEKGLADMRYECYARSILLAPAAGDHVLAPHITTYFNRGYDGEHWYFYTPPRHETGYAAALLNKDGTVGQVAFPLFSAFRKTLSRAHKALIGQMLKALLPKPLLRAASLPSTARASVAKGEGYTLLHVKVTYPEHRAESGIVEEHTVLPAGKTIALRGAFQTAVTLPDRAPVPFTVEDGYTLLTLPEITGYALICLE